jgi:hypothetical protein
LGVPVAVLMSNSRREIQVDAADVLRRELLALTQGRSEKELRKVVKVVRAVLEELGVLLCQSSPCFG